MASREADEESKSYSALFLVAVGLLLLGSIWSIWDDNIARRPWKKHQATFYDMERELVEKQIAEEQARLEKDPKYQEITTKLDEVREALSSGETAHRLAALQRDLDRVSVTESEWDLSLRIVKSEIEEARYEYEHAVEIGGSGQKQREYLQRKEAEKAEIEKNYHDAQAKRAEIENEIKTIRSEEKRLEDQLREVTTERMLLETKLDNLLLAKIEIGPWTIPITQIPSIQQVVINEFDRNAYDQPVARVDRCTSCHAGIEKEGFEDAPHPYRTHPRLQEILWTHPPEKFGCTPCHEGQGPAVNSPAMAHGEVIFWERPLMRGDKIEANCITCHQDVRRLDLADRIVEGEQLFEQLGCHGCHLVEGYDGLPDTGPTLRPAAAKLDPGWTVEWIENPHGFRPGTRMPWFVFDRDESIQAAAYLLHASKEEAEKWLAEHPEPTGVDPADAALVARGKELADAVGCRGCHAFEPDERQAPLSETKDLAPNLSRIGEKADARWIYHWIRDPKGYNPESRMPSLRLTDGETAAITSYLLTLRNGGAEPEAEEDLGARLADADTIAAGEGLVRKYGCYACHDIPGMEKESRIGVELSSFGSKNLEEFFFGEHKEIPHDWDHWTYHKLKDPRIYETEFIEQMMPNFRLGEDEIRALRVFLASRVDHKVPENYRYPDPHGFQKALVEGRRLVDFYNCRGCHVIDDVGGDILAHYEDNPALAPPNLRGEGRKVQQGWLYGFLKDPTPIRPWLQVRMPTFGFDDEEAAALVEYFQALDEVRDPYVFVNEKGIPEENLEAARVMVAEDYFSCFSCHQDGDKKPEGPPEGWAPDLAMARQRLNPGWIVDWIRDPQALMPGTKMPAYYPGGPDDILDGDEERQIRALRDYLMVLGTRGARLARDTATIEPEPSS